ncbi:uncharacterized protein A1O9_10343 [Exophiala aquamarina CBS 119918]|uniref:Uncharacterized protein n=1 Tax=Exophiala aquamarina CBS 119918 TaxID=1182545 RepID=A0A072P274_9EURO|nr:uncharacterized protein A1O9_10343 [Exophiala aquamarina CBS 119918]KEF53368.1 hypothetical protein A1O9_10343 [Exophiala aquamarina CBS 119918]
MVSIPHDGTAANGHQSTTTPNPNSDSRVLSNNDGEALEESQAPSHSHVMHTPLTLPHIDSGSARHQAQHHINGSESVEGKESQVQEGNQSSSDQAQGAAAIASTALGSTDTSLEDSASQQDGDVSRSHLESLNHSTALHSDGSPTSSGGTSSGCSSQLTGSSAGTAADAGADAGAGADAILLDAPHNDTDLNPSEKRSWKISVKWLLLLTTTDLLIIATIISLDIMSRRHFGFVDIGSAPSFLSHDEAVEQAIWSQGILYTALPSFLMTMFHTAWNTALGAFVKRQPYVELRKKTGEISRKTLMFEYTEPYIFCVRSAIENGHLLLAACMLLSATLIFFVVPVTAFMFTTREFGLNSTLPISIERNFNTSIFQNSTSIPSLRFMEAAAAIHIQNASWAPWTTETYAFPASTPLMAVGTGNVTYNSIAYSAEADCVYLEEDKYRKHILLPGETGIPAITIMISANDRGCLIGSSLNLELNSDSPSRFIHSWTTTTCPAHSGWSRFSFLAGRITQDEQLADFGLISCTTSYYNTTGSLTADWLQDPMTAPGIRDFRATSRSEWKADAIWFPLEWGMQETGCYDPMEEIRSTEFPRQVYRIAKTRNSTSPLLPEVIIDAAQTLFPTMYAIFATSTLLQPTDEPMQQLATMSVQRTRLIVVPAVAYPVVSILCIVFGLTIALFFYAKQESILTEEPVGMLATAAILHKSADVYLAIARLLVDPKLEPRYFQDQGGIELT